MPTYLMKVLDVVGCDAGISADFVDELRDGSDDVGADLGRLLLVKPRLGVEAVALSQTGMEGGRADGKRIEERKGREGRKDRGRTFGQRNK